MLSANSIATVPYDSLTEISGVYYFPGSESTLQRGTALRSSLPPEREHALFLIALSQESGHLRKQRASQEGQGSKQTYPRC